MRTKLEDMAEDLSFKEAKELTSASMKKAKDLHPEDVADQKRQHHEDMRTMMDENQKTIKKMGEAMRQMKKMRPKQKTGDPTMDSLMDTLDSFWDKDGGDSR